MVREPWARGSPQGETPRPTQSAQYCEGGQGQGGLQLETGELGTQCSREPEQRKKGKKVKKEAKADCRSGYTVSECHLRWAQPGTTWNSLLGLHIPTERWPNTHNRKDCLQDPLLGLPVVCLSLSLALSLHLPTLSSPPPSLFLTPALSGLWLSWSFSSA